MVALLVGLPFFSFCQEPENLVLNPSFEELNSCQPSPNNIEYIQYWQDAFLNGSTGFFSDCDNTYFGPYSVPNNLLGYQRARTGHSMAFQSNFKIGPNGYYLRRPIANEPYISKEPLTGTFKENLLKDSLYYLEFYVSLCDLESDQIIATNSFDLLIHSTLDNLTYPSSPHFSIEEMVWSNPDDNIISDTSEWVKLSGCFKANGGEKYFSVGSFRDTLEFSNQFYGTSPNGYSAYYYYDDFLIYQCDTCCPDQYPVQDYITVNNTLLQQGDPVYFETFLNKGNTANLYLFDSAGRIVYQHYLSGTDNTHQIPISLAAGIYHYAMVTSEKKKLGGKIVVL